MTTNPPAQPRPPPNVLTGLARHRSYSSLPTVGVTADGQKVSEDGSMASDGDERPSKRRRIVSHGSSPVNAPASLFTGQERGELLPVRKAKYSRVDWQDAVSGRYTKPTPANEGRKEPPPLPRPPWGKGQTAEPLPVRVRTSCRYRADVPVPNTPDSLKCSVSAPILDSKKPADYFPWAGKHAEDVINESNVKNGYWDRAPHPSDRELNTAKAPLYNAFKHRSGLESLSTLFTLVLDRKAKHNALSSASTFRPPPRVTLTESKRRSWIADLADNDVPLRRLSRTIPQGIRGLPLLEQCLLNSVPVNRAIWFLKCVGANEIRTLKRKGVNPNITVDAEHKWLQEWTMNIEQFLETAIGQCGSEKWYESVRYCMQLCTRLYQENLLDRDYFLDCIVKSFAACSLEMLAAWLPLIQMFQADLLRFRKRARRLAGAFLMRFKQISELNAQTTPLGQKLHGAIRATAAKIPACFLMPDQWRGYRATLLSCLNLQNDQEKRTFDQIEQRNERLVGTDMLDEATATNPRGVYDCLDAAMAPFNANQLSDKLTTLCADRRQLSKLCLEWASSRFRGGSYRIYLVARLLRRWQRLGSDIDNAILEFFCQHRDTSALDIDNYRHIFAELSRSQSFPKSRFLQTLSIRVNNSSHIHSCLLQDLYLDEAEDHLVNLRNHLLSKEQARNNEGLDDARQHLKAVQKAVSDAAARSANEAHQLGLSALRQLAWSAKFEISAWLRLEATAMSKLAAFEVPGRPPLPGSKLLTLSQFLVLRDVLEAMGDTAALADVLHCLSNTKQELILASLVDTVHYNATALSAIGALEPLQKLYGQSYIALRTMRPCILVFATALINLCQYYPCQVTPLRALQQDMIRGDRGRALAACSPFSNGVAESLQQAGATFIEDFEAILLGEPNMSEQTMTSLFGVLVSRIMKSDGEAPEQSTFILCQLLARLRLLRPIQGDALIRKWLSRLFSAAWSSVHQNIVLELLYTRCITFDILLDLASQAPTASKCKQAVREMVSASILSQPDLPGRPQYAYVLKIAAARLSAADSSRCLDILLSQNDRGPALLRECAVILPGMLCDDKKLSVLSPVASRSLGMVVDELLNVKMNSEDTLTQLMARANWLSLPFCCYRMPGILGNISGEAPDGDTEKKAKEVYNGLRLHETTDRLHSDITQALLAATPASVQDRVRAIAELQFYESLPKFFQAKSISQPLQCTLEEKKQSIATVDEVVALGSARRSSLTVDSNRALIEKLTIIAKALVSRGDGQQTNPGNPTPSSPIPPALQSLQAALPLPQAEYRQKENIMTIVDYLNMLLRVVCTKVDLFAPSAGNAAVLPKVVQNEQIKLVVLLASIATQPSLAVFLQSHHDEWSKTKVRECMGFALDVASRMADDLSDEARIFCARILKDRLRDDRIMWLFGNMNSCPAVNNTAGHGLVIMHETKGFLGEFKPKPWEMLESGGGKESDTCLGLGLFGAKRV